MSAVCRICASNIDSATWIIEHCSELASESNLIPKFSPGARVPKKSIRWSPIKLK
jgi:hypothetical protein